jgi:hypothetical protein
MSIYYIYMTTYLLHQVAEASRYGGSITYAYMQWFPPFHFSDEFRYIHVQLHELFCTYR